MAKVLTKSTTQATVLTAITVAAAGVAAYAVATLSDQPQTTVEQASGVAQQELRRSCVYACQDNAGSPCVSYADPQAAAVCQQRVQACIAQCPSAGPGITMLLGDLSVERLPAAARGSAYRQRLAISRYEQEQGIWTVTEGALPTGLELDPQGTLFGTPTGDTGPYRFTVAFTVPAVKGVREPLRAKAVLELMVEARATQPVGSADALISAQTTDPRIGTMFIGGSNALTFGQTTDPATGPSVRSLPVGRITTPVKNVSIPLGRPYELRLAVEGLPAGQTPVWFVSYGKPPEGLKLQSDGVLSGTPVVEGPASFGIGLRLAESGSSVVAYADATMIVTPASDVLSGSGSAPVATGALSPENATLPAGRVGTFASFPFSVAGDSSERVWTATPVPDGMKFDRDTHVLYGTPLRAAAYSVEVTAAKGSQIVKKTYAWTVAADTAPLEVVTTLPEGRADQDYVASLRASGATPPYRWSFEQPNAVARIWTLSAAGELKGTAPKEGVYTFLVRLEDATGLAKSFQVVVNIRAGATAGGSSGSGTTGTGTASAKQLTIAQTLPEGRAGQKYSTALRALGGSGSYVWKFADGWTVPAGGWTLSSAGTLRAPETITEGTYAFRVQVQDTGLNLIQDGEVKVAILAANGILQQPPQTIETTATQTNTTTSATGSGSQNGTTGNQTSGGTQNTGSGSTSGGSTVTAALAFRDVNAYPDGFTTYYYNARPFEVTGGRPPYRYTVSGALPDGLTVNASGAISGTPSRVGTFNFTMTVRDEAGDTIQAARVIRIREFTQHIYADSLPLTGTTASASPALQARLAVYARAGVRIHDLVKLQDDGDINTQVDSTVYYLGTDGRRHAFPNPQAYYTWFPDFGNVRIIGAQDLADIPLGANITYRPGVRLVKFTTDPRVYLVDRNRVLRWVKTEGDAATIYGPAWRSNVHDISDAFYMDYRIEGSVDLPNNVRPSDLAVSTPWPSDILPQ